MRRSAPSSSLLYTEALLDWVGVLRRADCAELEESSLFANVGVVCVFPLSGFVVSTGEGFKFLPSAPCGDVVLFISLSTMCGASVRIAAPLVALRLLIGLSLGSSSVTELVEAFLDFVGELVKNTDGFVSVGSLPSGDTKLGDEVVLGERPEVI